jgi:hypothetical protein
LILNSIVFYADPSFALLQFTSYPYISSNPNIPLPIPNDEASLRALKVLDRTPVLDLHKIGIVYIGRKQYKEVDILSNTHGSTLYTQFLHSLGKLIPLKGSKEYTGGLDTVAGVDGEYAVVWEDSASATQIVFHTTTLMPTHLDRDPQCSLKKRHIGNDFVTIAYDDSGFDTNETVPLAPSSSSASNSDTLAPAAENKVFGFHTLPGQFNFVNIVIKPCENKVRQEKNRPAPGPAIPPSSSSSTTAMATSSASTSSSSEDLSLSTSSAFYNDDHFFTVSMTFKPELNISNLGLFADTRLVSGRELPGLVRYTALHANMLALVAAQGGAGGGMFASTAKERLRQIKRLGGRIRAGRSGNEKGKEDGLEYGDVERSLDFTRFS